MKVDQLLTCHLLATRRRQLAHALRAAERWPDLVEIRINTFLLNDMEQVRETRDGLHFAGKGAPCDVSAAVRAELTKQIDRIDAMLAEQGIDLAPAPAPDTLH